MNFDDDVYKINIERIETSLYKVEILYEENYYIFLVFMYDIPIFYDMLKKKIYEYDDPYKNSFLIPMLYLINDENFGYRVKSLNDIINTCKENKCSFIDILELKLPKIQITINNEHRNQVQNYINNIY